MNDDVFFEQMYRDDNNLCWYCRGDRFGIVGVHWDSDDPINGPYDGEVERCPCCNGTGKAEDCTFW